MTPLADILGESVVPEETRDSGRWYVRHWVDEFLWDKHENMSTIDELEFVSGLRKYAAIFNGEPVPRSSGCTGCDIKSHIDNCLARLWQLRYNITINFHHNLRSEINPAKQEFLKNQFPETG